VYELSQLSLKFERHFDAEIVEFQVWPGPRLLHCRRRFSLRVTPQH